jgi:hypothetical protein
MTNATENINKSVSAIGVPSGGPRLTGKILTTTEAGRDSAARTRSPAQIHALSLTLAAAKAGAETNSNTIANTISPLCQRRCAQRQ